MISIFFYYSFIATVLAAICYHPDGTPAPPAYQPCTSPGISMCCATNRTEYPNSCRPDGLCVQLDNGVIWRESCTDKTWRSSQCLHLCSTGSDPTVDDFTDDVAVTVCADRSYCCGYQNYECCAAKAGYWVVDGVATSADMKGTSSSTIVIVMSSIQFNPGTSTSLPGAGTAATTPSSAAPPLSTLSSSTASQYTAPRISTASDISSPTIIACSDPSWEPNPQNWADAQVDSELASWWSRTASERGSRTFVDWISSSFGDTSRGQHCGISSSSSCSAPDCQSFRGAGGPRWVYFVRLSLVELNTLFNVMNSGISTAETNLALLMQDIAVNFFPWKDSKTDLQKAVPWITAGFNAAFSFIPAGFLVRYATNALVGTTKEFSSAGLQMLSTLPGGIQPADYYAATIQELGAFLESTSKEARGALEAWSKTLFDGSNDVSGKNILNYMAGGRFTAGNGVSASQLETFYLKLQISKLVNEQWKNQTKTFVMCSNSSTSSCHESSQYSEAGRTCCLYRIDDKAKYLSPEALAKLQAPAYDIKPEEITASSLHSYLAENFSYDENSINQRVETSLSSKPTDQFLLQGIKFQGVWTLPVCDVGTHSDWIANYAEMKLPCCCGVACSETKAFMKAANMAGVKLVDEACASQFLDYESVAGRLGPIGMVSFAVVMFLGLCVVLVV